jgi:hypothetical protein
MNRINKGVVLFCVVFFCSEFLFPALAQAAPLELAEDDGAAINVIPNALAQLDRPQWRALTNKPLDFNKSLDVVHEKPGQTIHLFSDKVTFDYDFNGIAVVEPGGQLRLVRQTPFGLTSVKIEGNNWGGVSYQYEIDGQQVVDQWGAQQFVEQILHDSVGEGVHRWKVSQLTKLRYINRRLIRTKTNARKLTGNRLVSALRNEDGFFSAQDLKITKAILNAPALLRKRGERLLHVNGFNDQEQSTFFFGMANSGMHRASSFPDGALTFSHTKEDGTVENTHYQLNNDSLYRVFVEATGQQYSPGKTEQAMVDYFVRLHFKQNKDQITWLRE